MEALFGTVLFYTSTLKPTLNSSIIYNEETQLTYYSLEKLDQNNIEIPIYYNFPFVLNKDGSLWEEGEFDRGILVTFTVKEGKPFDPNQIIDISEDPEMANLLFE